MTDFVVLISGLLISGNVAAQSWVVAEGPFWYWPGAVEWSPDETTLAEAMERLEVAFQRAAEAETSGRVPDWSAYTLEYQGRIVEGARVIRVVGDCDPERRVVTREDGTKDRIIVTGGGGTCMFRATYDTTTKEVAGLSFNGPY